jgi:hypothetical protein
MDKDVENQTEGEDKECWRDRIERIGMEKRMSTEMRGIVVLRMDKMKMKTEERTYLVDLELGTVSLEDMNFGNQIRRLEWKSCMERKRKDMIGCLNTDLLLLFIA